MAKFTVLSTILDRIDHSAGFHEDGRPKKIVEHKRGDVVEFDGYEDDQLQRLVDLNAIRPATRKDVADKEGGGTPPPGDDQRGQAQ